MQLLIRKYLVWVLDCALFDSLVVLFQLSDQKLEAVSLLDERIVGEGDVKRVGTWFYFVHESFEVVPAALDDLFFA